MIRFKNYRQKPKFQWKKYLNQTTYKYAAISLAVVVSCIFLILLFQNKKGAAKTTALYTAREIIIGVSAPSAFASADESGEIIGFERDVAGTVFSFVYPDQQITFVEIENQEASYLLKIGEIDAAIGMYTEGVLKTQGLTLTGSYFNDTLYAYVSPENATAILFSLNNKTLRAMTSEVKKSTVVSYLSDQGVDATVAVCTSYPDGIQDVLSGNAAALITSRYKMIGYDELSLLNDPLGSVSYHILFWKTNTDAAALITDALTTLRSDGLLAQLMEKWEIEEYDD